jgi:hypothetical protein
MSAPAAKALSLPVVERVELLRPVQPDQAGGQRAGGVVAALGQDAFVVHRGQSPSIRLQELSLYVRKLTDRAAVA